ncbi:unnamed protein product [Dimorphilus gyrociliatus]|uniref:Uncharacterized protein n=1 Tax=Dimorphilus gyrociliatus TaxID=2664684 RepID=A0A7I8VUX0_9ANNE|nr:unnamed protein product [Dimorphilus gyrociliatus]
MELSREIQKLRKIIDDSKEKNIKLLNKHFEHLEERLETEKRRLRQEVFDNLEETNNQLTKFNVAFTEYSNFRSSTFQEPKQRMKEILMELETSITCRELELRIQENLDNKIAEVQVKEGFIYNFTVMPFDIVNGRISDHSSIISNETDIFLMNTSPENTTITDINTSEVSDIVLNRWESRGAYESFSISPDELFILLCDRVNGLILKSKIAEATLNFREYLKVDDVRKAYATSNGQTLVWHENKLTLFNADNSSQWSHTLDNIEAVAFSGLDKADIFMTKEENEIRIRSLFSGLEEKAFNINIEVAEMYSLPFGILLLPQNEKRLILLSKKNGSIIAEFPLNFTPKTMAISLNILNLTFYVISDKNELFVMK